MGLPNKIVSSARISRRFSRRTTRRAIWLGIALSSFAFAARPMKAQQGPPTRITLEQALDLAGRHNHALLAARNTILQSQASEITANLRPNPTINWDAQFLPFFNPSNFTGTYLNNSAQFDLGIGYLFERGQKRQHRLEAAKDQTSVTQSVVSDNERTLSFNVAQQFVAVLLAQSTLDFAEQDLKSFQQTVDIGEAQYKAGDISEGDLLKIKLQLLQFQMDVSQAQLSLVQAYASLRALEGYDALPAGYDVWATSLTSP